MDFFGLRGGVGQSSGDRNVNKGEGNDEERRRILPPTTVAAAAGGDIANLPPPPPPATGNDVADEALAEAAAAMAGSTTSCDDDDEEEGGADYEEGDEPERRLLRPSGSLPYPPHQASSPPTASSYPWQRQPPGGGTPQLSVRQKADLYDSHARAADALSRRLLDLGGDDEDLEHRILRRELDLSDHPSLVDDYDEEEEGGDEEEDDDGGFGAMKEQSRAQARKDAGDQKPPAIIASGGGGSAAEGTEGSSPSGSEGNKPRQRPRGVSFSGGAPTPPPTPNAYGSFADAVDVVGGTTTSAATVGQVMKHRLTTPPLRTTVSLRPGLPGAPPPPVPPLGPGAIPLGYRSVRLSRASMLSSRSSLASSSGYYGGGGYPPHVSHSQRPVPVSSPGSKFPPLSIGALPTPEEKDEDTAVRNICLMVALALMVLLALGGIFALGQVAVGPPRQPVGPYLLTQAQEGEAFFEYYNFYEGPDSAGSNGYNTYVSKEDAHDLEIVNVTTERIPYDEMPIVVPHNNGTAADVGGGMGVDGSIPQQQRSSPQPERREPFNPVDNGGADDPSDSETFVYMKSSPTPEGPRDSVRLEGKVRFNRGLFIIDLRHMPAGCGMWPAFWLTDEANWPVNGEIDIVEGVNYQSIAKTALHSTKVCNMDDVPMGAKTGTWDTAIGIPDKKTGVPDMTMRYATDCFVYDPHQWLNQGCVAMDVEGGTLGGPLNKKGGGVYALEWDPINRHIRTWVFSPHRKVPENLRNAMRTATAPDKERRVAPDPNQWGLPYGYFPIGDETNCPAYHFRNMRLVFNLAFCGSVAGNRYFMDCKKQSKTHKSCNEYIKSNPKELEEAYWKIRGVYVYEREWKNQWV